MPILSWLTRDEDVTRARAVQESWWKQSQLGDQTSSVTACQIIGKSAPCWQSYGILQVKGTVHRRTYPLAERSTAYNADYALAWLRACYEGAFSHWMGNGYRAGDEWGCVGAWYSGSWYDSGAQLYIASVKQHLGAKREPPRVCRRPVSLSQAASASSC
jgi:autotransporter family porin